MKIACVIVAAGQGIRLGDEWSDTPKALVPILGRPMLYYSLNAFDDFNGIDNKGGIGRFVITAPPDKLGDFRKLIKQWGFSVPFTVVVGGKTRSDSVLNGLKALADENPELVMIHDCARCCLTAQMIGNLTESVPDGESGTLAHPTADTLRLVKDRLIAEELNREEIAGIETPQLFPYAMILNYHEEMHSGSNQSVNPPDDTTLVTRSGGPVHVVYHDGNNLKVTYSEDIGAAGGILFSRGWMDVGDEED